MAGKKGHRGHPAHQKNATAAAIIEELRGYGVPQSLVSKFLDWAPGAIGIDLGGQGYSVDTLQRHYRDEMERAKAPGKELLMGQLYRMAMGEQLVEGVSPDTQFRIMADKVEKLLAIQHGVIAPSHHKHSEAGQPIPLAVIEEALTAEEMETFAFLYSKIERALEQ